MRTNSDSLRHAAAEAELAASRAKALIDNPVLAEAFERIEDAYIALWMSALRTEQREDIYFRVQGLKALRDDLAAVISGGKVAAYNTRGLQK